MKIETNAAKLLGCLVVAGLALAAPPPVAALEAQMYVITDWPSDCSAGDRPAWDNMVDAWYNRIDDFSGWSQDRRKVNGSDFKRKLFCDPDAKSGCYDYNHADEGDAVMVAVHGGDWGFHWRGKLRKKTSFSCYIYGKQSQMRMGDNDAEFLHLSSCHSMDDDNVPYTWDMMYDKNDTPNNHRSLHQVNGFHGIMWISDSSSYTDNYRDFASDSFSVSMGWAWVDNHHKTGVKGKYDQCPVSYAVSTSSRTDCLNRLGAERYNNIQSDPGGKPKHYCIYYIDGCNPKGDDAFTP